MHRYKSRRSALTADEAARWEMRYQIGAMIQAVALGLWCTVALFGSDDAVAHMICLTVTTGYVAGGAGRAYGRQWIFHVQIALACGPTAIALALRGTPYYIGMAVVSAVFFLALKQISTDSAADFRSSARGARARGGAGRSVRYRAEQHAAWAVHVWRRRPACGDESSFQRNDELIRRSRAKWRQRFRHHRCLRRRRIDLCGERQDNPRGNREFAGEGHRYRPIPTSPETGRCPGPSSRWPAAARSCWWKISPSARNAEARISHLARL